MRSKSDKSSKYFLNREKPNKTKSHVRKLLTETDDEISNPSEIMICIKYFYSSLYKQWSLQTEAECLDYLSRINIPSLIQAESDSDEGLLTKRQCWETLSLMKNGKRPGSDGLTKEFYVCFFDEINQSLIDALNELSI